MLGSGLALVGVETLVFATLSLLFLNLPLGIYLTSITARLPFGRRARLLLTAATVVTVGFILVAELLLLFDTSLVAMLAAIVAPPAPFPAMPATTRGVIAALAILVIATVSFALFAGKTERRLRERHLRKTDWIRHRARNGRSDEQAA